jgi:hypothetical protein
MKNVRDVVNAIKQSDALSIFQPLPLYPCGLFVLGVLFLNPVDGSFNPFSTSFCGPFLGVLCS